MIELLVVIAIATIGVVYTSSTGEAESSATADKSAKDALNETEGQRGIGILGIDVVARKMRQMVGLPDGAVSAETLAEYRGDDDHVHTADAGADPAADPWDTARATGEWVDEGDNAAALDEDWGEGMGAGATNDWADHALQDEVIERARLAAQMDDPDETETVLQAVSEAAGEETDDMDDTDDLGDLGDMSAILSDVVAEDQPAEDTVEPEAPRSRNAAADPGMDTQDAPMVEDFDPEQDQILIGYRPGEAGNGRIGIMEDPLRPGSAAVTLGGRCVAVVLDGFGKVRAHHIELVCEEDDDVLAA